MIHRGSGPFWRQTHLYYPAVSQSHLPYQRGVLSGKKAFTNTGERFAHFG